VIKVAASIAAEGNAAAHIQVFGWLVLGRDARLGEHRRELLPGGQPDE
jgi:hypothetical protein